MTHACEFCRVHGLYYTKVRKLMIYLIGGGPAGCALKYFFESKGHSTHLIERNSVPGGMSRSHLVRHEGEEYILDTGPHIFHSPDEEITNLWKEIFGDLLREQRFFSANVKGKQNNEYHPYPLDIEFLRSKYGDSFRPGIVDKQPSESAMVSYRSVMQEKFGERIEREYFRKYPEKLWGIPTSEMRADWAPKRIKLLEHNSDFFHGQFSSSCLKGSGALYERLVRNGLQGSKTSFNSTVTSLEIKSGRIIEIVINGKERIALSGRDMVVSSIPVTIMGKLLGIDTSLKYRGVAVYNIRVSGADSSLKDGYSWLYYEDSSLAFTRITDYTKLSPNAVPQGQLVVSVECPFDGSSTADFQDLPSGEEICRQLETLELFKGKTLTVLNRVVERYVYPIRELGYEQDLAAYRSAVSRVANLYSVGASGEYEYSDAQVVFRKCLDFVQDIDDDCKRETSFVLKDSQIKEDSSRFLHAASDISMSSNGEQPLLISEIGLNHNGSTEMAVRLIEESARAGADYVKFQIYQEDSRAAVNRRDSFYSEQADGEGENLNQLFNSCRLSVESLRRLVSCAEEQKVKLFFSAFDPESIILARQLSPTLIKISSMDLTNYDVVQSAAMNFAHIIMSTGMSSKRDIARSLSSIRSINRTSEVTLLHCISSYPFHISEASLGSIEWLRSFGCSVGYSDHALGVDMCKVALIKGATVIEKHFTLDKSLKGPDHIHSATPGEFRSLSDFRANLQGILSSRTDKVSDVQKAVLRQQKKGYFFAQDVNAGAVLTRKMLAVGTPCLGMDTFAAQEHLGRTITKDVVTGQPLDSSIFV